jgi:hypothetical protein
MCAGAEREREYLKGVVQIGGKTLLVHVATLLGSEMSPREHKTCLQQLMINICPGSIRARCFPFAEGAAHCESVQFDNNCVLGLNAVTWKSTALNRAWLELGALSKQN